MNVLQELDPEDQEISSAVWCSANCARSSNGQDVGGMSMRTMLTIGALCLVVGTADAQDYRVAPIFSQQRFQIVTNANDTFLLDTTTGQVWLLTKYTDYNKDPLAWAPMYRLETPADTGYLVREYGLKPRR
jgi:hypothetical protein